MGNSAEIPQPWRDGDLALVVDAGGSKTACWLTRRLSNGQFDIVGRGQAGCGNPLSAGFDAAMEQIAAAIRAARGVTDVAATPVARAVLSVAGAANAEVASQVSAWARGVALAQCVAVVSDVLPILAAGLESDTGVGCALIAGTGSVALARTREGRIVRCGGWGYLLGDEGSGYAIGRAAVTATLASLENAAAARPPIAAAVLAELNATSVPALTKIIYSHPQPRRRIADFARVVIEAAESHDPAAQLILNTAARDLAALVARTAAAAELDAESFTLTSAGGVLGNSPYLYNRLAGELYGLKLAARLSLLDDPLTGCLRLLEPTLCPLDVAWSG